MHQRARKLRRVSTDAERLLWHHLRNRSFCGLKFRRQHPVDRYFADFACIERRLVIELDGGHHLEHTKRDLERTRRLNVLGWRVVRFWDDDVLMRTNEVLAELHRVVIGSSPWPSPREAG